MRIREFQEMMKRIYYEKDRRRGVERTYIWLVEEVGELGRAIIRGDIREIGTEVADVMAWLASLCNLLELDLEKMCLNKYPGVCPRCGSVPCKCNEPRGRRLAL